MRNARPPPHRQILGAVTDVVEPARAETSDQGRGFTFTGEVGLTVAGHHLVEQAQMLRDTPANPFIGTCHQQNLAPPLPLSSYKGHHIIGVGRPARIERQ